MRNRTQTKLRMVPTALVDSEASGPVQGGSQSDFEPRNIQNMRDAAIQKKVFSFPVVEGKKEKKN